MTFGVFSDLLHVNLCVSITLSLRMDLSKNWTKISLTLRNSFIPLEKTDSVNVEAVEMNQTEAFQQQIELVSVLRLFFPVFFLHKFNYALNHLFVYSFIYCLFMF